MTSANHTTKTFDAATRAQFTLELMKYLRPYTHHKKLLFKSINFPYLFDSIEIFLNKGDFKDSNKAIEWIKIAEEDLKAAKMLHLGENTKSVALYHLQQAIEKLLKATLLYFGFRNEKQIIKLKHKPQKFLLTLLEDQKIKEILGEKYPFTQIEKPGKYDDEKLKEIKHNIVNKKKMLEEQDIFINFIEKTINKGHPLIQSSNLWYDSIKKGYEKIPPGERKKFQNKLNTPGMNFDNVMKEIGTVFWLYTNFIFILFPLSTTTWVFESITRYPDERRKLKTEIKDLKINQNFNLIITRLEEYIDTFKRLV